MSKQSKRERQRLNREARREYEEQLARRRTTFKAVRAFAILAIPVIAVGAYLSLSGEDEVHPAVAVGCREVKKDPKPKDAQFTEAEPTITDSTKTYEAVVQTSCGSFTIQLAAAEAPQTINSFAFLAGNGFYEDTTFHRIVKNFVVQGGDPKGDGTGGPGYTLPDEPPTEPYQLGTVAMANAGPGSTGSQFYVITTQNGADTLNSQLTADGKFSYSILGQVTEGFETITRMNKLGRKTEAGKPKATVVIDKITISEQAPETTPSS